MLPLRTLLRLSTAGTRLVASSTARSVSRVPLTRMTVAGTCPIRFASAASSGSTGPTTPTTSNPLKSGATKTATPTSNAPKSSTGSTHAPPPPPPPTTNTFPSNESLVRRMRGLKATADDSPDALLRTLARDAAIAARVAADVARRIAGASENDGERDAITGLTSIADWLDTLKLRERATTAFDAIEKKDLKAYNNAINVNAIYADPDAALALIKTMIEQLSIQPNVDTFSHMILAYANTKNVAEAQKWFDVYRNSDEPTSDGPYNNLVTAYVNAGDLPGALNVLSVIMAEDNIPLTSSHFANFLDALNLNNHHSQVIDWYTRLSSDKAGQFPPVNDAILDIAFDSAVTLKLNPLIQQLYPTATSRAPTSLSLCTYGSSVLKSKTPNVAEALKVVKTLNENGNIADPLLPTFFIDVIKVPHHLKSEFPDADVFIQQTAVKRDCFERVVRFITRQGVINCGNDFAAALKWFKFCEEQGAAVGRSREALWESYLENGIQKPDGNGPKLSEKDFETLFNICDHSKRSWDILFEDLKSRKMAVTKGMSDAAIAGMRANDRKQALNEWIKLMRQKGIIRGSLVEGEQISWEVMQTLNTQIMDLCKKKRLDQALKIKDDVLASTTWFPSIQATHSLITTMMGANRIPEALEFSKIAMAAAENLNGSAERKYGIQDSLMTGYLLADDIPAALEQANQILSTFNRLPFNRNIGKLVSRSTFHHQSKLSDPSKAPLALVAETISRFLPHLDLYKSKAGTGESVRDLEAITWNDIVWILSRGGKLKDALEVYQAKRNLIRAPAHKALLSASCAMATDASQPLELLDDALEQYLEIGAGTFGFLDGSWFDPVVVMLVERFDNVEGAVGVWKEMQRAAGARMGGKAYRVLVPKALEKDALRESCVSMLVEMKKSNYLVDREWVDKVWGSEVGQATVLALKGNYAFLFSRIIADLGRKAEKSAAVTQEVKEEVVDSAIPQDLLEWALRTQLNNYREDKSLQDFVRLTRMLLKSYKAPSTTKLAKSMILNLSRQGAFEEALNLLASLSPPSAEATSENARSLECVSILVFNATKLGNDEIAAKGLAILKEDGFPDEEVTMVTDGVKQIKERLGAAQ
ncbi:hypothetical protein BCR33DRAFT_847168 [Rhizoclosmatium globosum]|uniref:Pentacotripeptide-repeat region of PRORP domain-containing protein n=1 Tax=Rhizoclosmatium globosum TaxID=329046 RepID=A0A1Y2CSC7_9FUNG|nr:hypothetical protein BCR33DRAFT_847168 [Rhizoclosmatium globosum]|eukprot:ORY49912.1 hypothetical protein BCR33DRAFT_847168 [Rhizoclosmatium globosum]